MGPKKKGDGRTKKKVGNAPHDGSSSRPTVQKGVAQLQISAENQQRLRRLLQNSSQVSSRSSSSPQGITSSREPLSQLEKQQATRRLRVIYDKLVSEGFSAGQIELGLSSFAAGEATLENVLDWLCLNIPGDELPKKFSSGVVDVDMEGSTVQLLAAAKKDWVPSMARSEIHEESHGLQLLVKDGNVKDDVVETSMKAHTAEWVKQYMYQLEEDSEDGGSLSSNDVNSDWEALAESQDRRHGGFEKIIQNHQTRTISEIISEFQYAKVAAADAKLKGDKQRQAISGQVIRRLKQELAAMGLSEDILCMNQTTADKRTDAEEVSEQGRDAELHLNMPVDLPGDISVDKITEDSKVEEQIESEDSLSGMFNEDSTTQNVLPSSVVQMQNKEKVMSWGLQTSDKKQKQQKDKKSSNQENLQRQPKAILQQQCQKRGWGLPKYVKESEATNLYTYTVTIMRPDSGRGKNRTLGGKKTYKVPGESAGSKSIEEAQNIVATWTLFSLFPELPLYHIIPEPFRTMMLQWHAEGSETMKTDELQRERNRRANFIESLVTFKEQPEDGEVAWSSEGTNNSFARHHKEEIQSDSTRSSAKADPEKAKREAHLQDAESRNLLLEYQVKQKEKAYKVAHHLQCLKIYGGLF
ncbi:hypothetical protein KP509_1Z067800 [Ceratopteris richardii]|nr:hypothetical protein KP509_1Z067800 [Ceratopteris richardii]